MSPTARFPVASGRDPSVGLCSRCVHAKVVENRHGSRFYLCERSRTDSSFAKYPPLPVLDCPGFDYTDKTLED